MSFRNHESPRRIAAAWIFLLLPGLATGGCAFLGAPAELSCEGETCGDHGACEMADGLPQCRCDSGYFSSGLSCLQPWQLSSSGSLPPTLDGALPDGGHLPDGGDRDGGDDGMFVDADGVDSGDVDDSGAPVVPDVGPDSGSSDDADVPAQEPPVWVLIAGGRYTMSACPVETGQDGVVVSVADFHLTQTEVTVAQYRSCVTAGTCSEPDTAAQASTWDQPGHDDHPVNSVDWSQARTYCRWVGGRLPTEAEWEYGARSQGKTLDFPWGSQGATCTYAVMSVDGDGCGTGRTWPVCSKRAGNTGQDLCDMAGNVHEWVQDWFHQHCGDGDVRNPEGYRVVRGGCYRNPAWALRNTDRGRRLDSDRRPTLGFRCARN